MIWISNRMYKYYQWRGSSVVVAFSFVCEDCYVILLFRKCKVASVGRPLIFCSYYSVAGVTVNSNFLFAQAISAIKWNLLFYFFIHTIVKGGEVSESFWFSYNMSAMWSTLVWSNVFGKSIKLIEKAVYYNTGWTNRNFSSSNMILCRIKYNFNVIKWRILLVYNFYFSMLWAYDFSKHQIDMLLPLFVYKWLQCCHMGFFISYRILLTWLENLFITICVSNY